MFSFFKRTKASPNSAFTLTTVQCDWHCHVLYGIDDGAQNEAQTLEMLQEYVSLGIKKIVATPHVRADYFKNTSDTIKKAHEKVERLISQNNLPLVLEASAEYFADENFLGLIKKNELLPIESQYILFELPMQQFPWGIKLVEEIQQKGYTPVLAHPERYRYWHTKPNEWKIWKNKGVCFQLNLLSLTGYYGKAERRMAEQLLDADYIDVVGTDAHGVRHLQKLADLNGNPYFDKLQQLPLLNHLG
ncbi:tyrosine-protein phosphatase [Runella zeae]|uniref:tyrosine-protein phosphatase n=1 Tax=Runella zeae TaxID=94255 RepID=UPI000423BBA9|nr:CpsB/CapC family capsule biosynthesis tyrosine phosphatase [Runella zeae]